MTNKLKQAKISTSSRFPHPHSAQRRYFDLALLIAIVFSAISWWGYQYINQVSEGQVTGIQQRANVRAELSQVHTHLRNIQEQLYWQLLAPGTTKNRLLDDNVQSLKQLLKVSGSLSGEGQVALASLQQEITQFFVRIEHFMEISTDVHQRIPSTLVMRNDMLPHANEAKAILTQLNLELAQSEENPELLHISYEMRYEWLNLMSEFRLLMANWSGLFSEPSKANMTDLADNILVYMKQFKKDLATAKQLEVPEMLFLSDENYWLTLEQHTSQWFQYAYQLSQEFSLEGWRQDLSFFKSKITPAIRKIEFQMYGLDSLIEGQAASDINSLTRLTTQISALVLYLQIGGMLLLLFTYFFLKKKILQPIAEITHALKMEAQGNQGYTVPIPELEETKDLVQAFHEMRQQVQERHQGLDHLAHHDPLTNLPNRVLLKDRLDHALQIARRNDQTVALLFLDLDGFKEVNDNQGHLVGDKVLARVARRLSSSVRRSDTVARISGDEFAVLVEDVKNHKGICELADNILLALQKPLIIDEHKLRISASIGISLSSMDDTESRALIHDADTAMYEAKRKGKANYQFFSDHLALREQYRSDLEQKLYLAAQNSEFLLHYQPIVNLKDNKLQSLETLLRWQPQDQELQYPRDFLSTLLDMDINGKIVPELLDDITDTQKQLVQHDIAGAAIAFHISSDTLSNKKRLKEVIGLFKASNVNMQSLIIEITEDALLENLKHAVYLLKKLQDMGAKIALDNFGAGPSSLNPVRLFEFDFIKIDKQFVRNIVINEADASMIKAIIDIAHQFGAKVIAEGVENSDQYDFLVQAGCDQAQGYLICKPLPKDELDVFLQRIDQ